VAIADLASLIADGVGFKGTFRYAVGAPRKLLDVTKLRALGWQPRIALREGLAAA
jgi:GDP-L-fucose synthase